MPNTYLVSPVTSIYVCIYLLPWQQVKIFMDICLLWPRTCNWLRFHNTSYNKVYHVQINTTLVLFQLFHWKAITVQLMIIICTLTMMQMSTNMRKMQSLLSTYPHGLRLTTVWTFSVLCQHFKKKLSSNTQSSTTKWTNNYIFTKALFIWKVLQAFLIQSTNQWRKTKFCWPYSPVLFVNVNYQWDINHQVIKLSSLAFSIYTPPKLPQAKT